MSSGGGAPLSTLGGGGPSSIPGEGGPLSISGGSAERVALARAYCPAVGGRPLLRVGAKARAH
jgi:hypothetical protein